MDNHHPVSGRDGGARNGGGAGRRLLDESAQLELAISCGENFSSWFVKVRIEKLSLPS